LAVLDFPTSPTDGQIYSNWIYSTAKGAWKAKPLTAIKTVTSDTPPASPSNGDQWFNTLDGTLYIYVTDIDSSQWVESRAPITADGYYSPNYIINGGMDIWQRGTSFTNTAVAEYTADRWVELTSSMTSARSTDVPNPNFAYSLQSTVSSAGYNTTAQRIESAVIRQAGEVVTLSFWAKNLIGSNGIRVDFRYASAVDNFASTTSFSDVTISETLASTWTRYSTTISLVDLARTNGLEVRILRSNSAVSSSFLLTGVQLETGGVASPFRRNANSIQGELAACQRYYWRVASTGAGVRFAMGSQLSATQAEAMIFLPTEFRTVPTTVEFLSLFWTDGIVFNAAASNVAIYQNSTTKIIQVLLTFASNGAARYPGSISSQSAASYLGFSAEI
jgi:hypothetical protein